MRLRISLYEQQDLPNRPWSEVGSRRVTQGPPSTIIDDGQDNEPQVRSLRFCLVHPPPPRETQPLHLTELTTLVVGRDVGDLGLRIEDPKMSRRHFQLTWDHRQGAPRLTDSGSSNGTYLNGRSVTTAVLNRGDVIRAGATLFVVDDPSERASILRHLSRAAPSMLSILLIGETGTGKEVMARRVHEQSGRTGPFIPVNCAAIPRDLMAAEFFGHTKGAFSGAGAARPGLFAAARSGTLFLDEIGELSPELQPTLLRALQERKVRPVGAEREIDVDVRLIAATNRPLQELSGGGDFRADLYARLAQLVVPLSPLRERRLELLTLARELAEEASGTFHVSANAAEALLLWQWPHNVRELKSLVESQVVLQPAGSQITLRMLQELRPELGTEVRQRVRRTSSPPPPQDSGPSSPTNPLANRQQLEQLLARHAGNVSAVAEELGAHRTQVYRWMQRHGIDHRKR